MNFLSFICLGAEPIRLLGASGEQRPLPLLGRHRQDQRGGHGLSHTGDCFATSSCFLLMYTIDLHFNLKSRRAFRASSIQVISSLGTILKKRVFNHFDD